MNEDHGGAAHSACAGDLKDTLSRRTMEQPREVQFVIERECLEAGDYPTNLQEYPASVFVYWPPRTALSLAPNLESPCSSPLVYQLTESEARRLGYRRRGDDWYVCEHMGRVIE